MFWKKPTFTFTNAGGEPFDLIRCRENCFIKKDQVTVGYVQGLSASSSSLTIDHFAVDSGLIGKGQGEEVLREFAKLIEKQAPHIQTMDFNLGRATSNSNIQKLADAREALLNKVNAINVQQLLIKPGSIVVIGTWNKANW